MNALNAYNALNANVSGLKKASEKLSSGYRINRAGDDAAGLAISEKMRSQIRGLNQAVRNSQDGINMIQTFEGAAQETHSILQRMKELAVESANGTYDNATDRAAIQLEFDQLNDELNQIADTDFNGTIVLNGGRMADGLKAVDGEFNYKEAHDAMFNADGTVNSPVKTDVTTYKAPNTDEAAGTTVTDNLPYGANQANDLWDVLGLDVKEHQEVNITFVKNDEGNWDGVMATDKNGNVLKNVNLKGVYTETIDATEDASGKGGFDVKWTKDGNETVMHNVFNAYKSEVGDHLTIKFTNTPDTTYAPTHAAVKESSFTADTTDKPNWNNGDLTFEVELGEVVTDANMNDDMKGKLDALAGVAFTIEYTAGKAAITGTDAKNLLTITDKGDGTAEVADDDGNVIATIKATNKGGAPVGVATDTNVTGAKATDVTIAATVGKGEYTAIADAAGNVKGWKTENATGYANGANGVIIDLKGAGNSAKTASVGDTLTIDSTGTNSSTVAGFSAADSTLSGLDDGTYTFDGTNWIFEDDLVAAADITLATGKTVANGNTVTVGTENLAAGKGTFKVDLAGYNVADKSTVKANSIASTSIDKFQSKLEEAMEGAGVTKANAFNNSTARLTYTDNITLQTGARTKDSVNFSFKYNTDGSADMGDLIANLDLSSRANGLNTANLSLANADDANYAIDQIDKAINKTSMVRATFGSIQNRLEHKITNLTTTAENLTEAESSIRDTDMASEMMNYTKFNILQQAAQSMLAQANQQPQSILQLLG